MRRLSNPLVLALVVASLAIGAGRASAVDYLIEVQTGGPGTATPSPNVVVPAGGSQTFTFSPSAGNGVVDVTVDDVSLGSGLTEYTFTNVQSDHILYVSFGPALPPPTPPVSVDTTLLSTDGRVSSIVSDGSTIYVGGSFTHVGTYTGNALALDASTGAAQWPYPNVAGDVAGQVNAVAPDGNGGWYLGGSFAEIRGQPRNHIAELDAAGNLTPWNPNADDVVWALAVSGGTVYVGGEFSSIGGQPRSCIAAVDATTGSPTAWSPNAYGPYGNPYVGDLAVSGTTVYACGFFNNIGGVARNNLAAIDAATGVVTNWNPNPDQSVDAVAVSGGTVYVGGSFGNIGGKARICFAALDAATGVATLFSPNPNNAVFALAVSGSTVYASGFFSTIYGQPRNKMAAINANTGLTAFDPNPSGYVYTLAVSGGTVYAGGDFTGIGGQPRENIAALDAATGAATAWNPSVSGTTNALAVSGGTVYAGGSFTIFGAKRRNGIAAFDAATGTLTSWDPNATGSSSQGNGFIAIQGVLALALSDGKVYAGGGFTGIGGQPRYYIASLDASTGTATAWSPSICCSDAFNHTDPYVRLLAAGGGMIYAGGRFSMVGGQQRPGIAAFDSTTGGTTPWNPGGGVGDVAVSGGTVYVAGSFTSIGGQPRNNLAALDVITGAASAWNPNPNGGVGVLAVSGGTIYAGGIFTNIGGQVRNDVAALDAGTGAATAWDPNANGTVSELAVSGSMVYAGGTFTSIGGLARNHIAALDAVTGAALSWDPNPNGYISTLAVIGGKVYVGGSFTSIGGQPRANFAAIFAPGIPVATAMPETPTQSGLTLLSPNPTSGGTHIHYSVARAGRVRLEVLDVSGRVEETLADRVHTPGRYVATWDGVGRRGRVSPGLYFVRLVAPDQVTMRKLAIIQ